MKEVKTPDLKKYYPDYLVYKGKTEEALSLQRSKNIGYFFIGKN